MSSGITTRWRRRCGGWWRRGLVPDRAGQPAKVVAHISLADLLELDAGSVLLDEWIGRVRAQWAAARAAAVGGRRGRRRVAGRRGGRGRSRATRRMTPVVTGEVDPARPGGPGPAVRPSWPGTAPAAAAPPAATPASPGSRRRTAPPRPAPGRGRCRRYRGRCSRLSGAGRRWSGRSSARRWSCCRVRAGWRRSCAAGSSAPGSAARACRWTSGYSENIPAGIRNAVRLRDQHCRWSGGCLQPAVGVRGAPRHAQGARRQDQRQRLRLAVLLPPPGRDPPVGLDPGPEPRRHHHRVEQGQDQGPAQPRPTRPRRVTPPAPAGAAGITGPARSHGIGHGHHQSLLTRAYKLRVADPAGSKPNPHRRTTPKDLGVFSGTPGYPGPRAGSPARSMTLVNTAMRSVVGSTGYAQSVTRRPCSRSAKYFEVK